MASNDEKTPDSDHDHLKTLAWPNLAFNVGESLNMLCGPEPRTDIRVTNKTSKTIELQLLGSRKEVKESLESGMTRIYTKRPMDGRSVIKTTNYECEFWTGSKHAKLFVYGQRAPRKDNLFEVHDDGIYLLDKRGINSYLLAKWDVDEVDFKPLSK